ncbi:MAG: hypothetical protein ACKOX0_06435, partial [Bacteroidota bacterium]
MKQSKLPALRWSVILGLALVGLVVFLVLRESQSHDDLSPEAYDFAVADTAAIDRIVLWNRSPDTAVLTRESGVWLINGAHPAGWAPLMSHTPDSRVSTAVSGL